MQKRDRTGWRRLSGVCIRRPSLQAAPGHDGSSRRGVDSTLRPAHRCRLHRFTLPAATMLAPVCSAWALPAAAAPSRHGVPLPIFTAAVLAALAVACWNLSLRRRIRATTALLTRQISARRRQADELRLSEERFQAIFNSVNDAIFIHDIESGSILEVNGRMTEMFGYSAEEARELHLDAISSGVPPYTEEHAQQWLRKAARGTPQLFEWQAKARDGRIFWMEVNVRRARILEHDVLLVTARDITDRKAAEQALQRSQQKFREIFENAPLAIFQSSIEGKFLSVNPAAAAIFGYAAPEELMREVSDIPAQLFVRPEQRRELIDSALKSYEFQRREVEYRRRDGSVFIANLYLRMVRNEAGEVLFSEGFVEDITERKRSEELARVLNAELEQRVSERTAELERANEALRLEIESRKRAQLEIGCLNDGLLRQRTALEAANKELETFSYSVSHDLRAPLRHISGYAGLLLEDCSSSLDEKARRYLERINVSTLKMQELIDGLLSLSRVIRGDLNTVPLDLSFYAREIAQALQQAEPERKVTFLIQEHITANADPVLIRSVLENLIGNAWKYSSKKEHAVIELGCELQEGTRVYFVRDNGAGFEMAYAGKLFGVFQRMHASDEFEGTGIGLATVQRIIHRHGGRIWAQAEVGKGATFYFTLG